MANQSIFRASEKGNLNLVRYFIETERVNVLKITKQKISDINK